MYRTLNQFKLNLLNKKLKNKCFFINKLNKKETFIIELNNSNLINSLKFKKFILYNVNTKIGISQLELKGVNYRFCFNMNKLLLDYGKSHYKVFLFKSNILLNLKKKKFKKLLIINFNPFNHFSITNFFRYSLKPVGPYKLKGFHFLNELVKLKEGKKPFK